VTGIDIPLLTTPIVKISGKVLDIPAGAQGVSVEVSYAPTQNLYEGFPVTCAKDGSFVYWGLDPGHYTLRAETGEGNDTLQAAPIELDLGRVNVDHLEMRLMAPFTVSGHVEYEDAQAREAAKARPERSTGLLRERSVGFWDESRSRTLQAEIGPDDSFTLPKVPPGQYSVRVALGHTYVRSVRLGSLEPQDDILDLRNGSGGDLVTVMVSANWAGISGTVTDASGPASGATVIVGGNIFIPTDAKGHYELKSLRPGTYKLLSSNTSEMTPEEFDDRAADIVTVELHAGDKITQDLKLSPVGKL
jgi:hypothetical protein